MHTIATQDLTSGLGFVDRILSVDETRIVATKNLSITEDYLLDHFGEYPVMPGVLMTQSIVEAAGWWLIQHLDFKVAGVRLREAINVRFANFLTPGQTLTMEVENRQIAEGIAEFQAKGRREESVVLSLRFTVNYDSLAEVLPASEAKRLEGALRLRFAALRGQ